MRTLKEELLLKVTRTLYGLNIQTGTVSDMQQLEDNFVAGSWIPSFKSLKSDKENIKIKTKAKRKPKKTNHKRISLRVRIYT